MPQNSKYDDDDYVAKLLAEDAKKSSQRYAAVGLSALLPKRPTKGAPKPNTRFLSHIVREADSHNAALRKREELESRMRLREMKERERRDEEGRERKRRRTDDDDRDERRKRRDRSRDRRRSASPRPRKRSDRDHRDGQRRSRRDEKESGRSRSHRHSSHSRERRPRDRDRLSPPSAGEKHTTRTQQKPRSKSTDSSSDPLEELVGPLPSTSNPPVRIRGRGAQRPSKSDIDTHFSSAYDPSLDVHPESESASEREDWDMALEALRDRTMWKKKQSERMREAGFGDDDIKKWEAGAAPGGESGDVRSVKWAKKGEAREWDVGKKGFDDP